MPSNLNTSILSQITNECTLRIEIKTPVKLNKKDKAGNPNDLGVITKSQKQLIIVNRSYETTVNQQREVENKSADFVSNGRSWGIQEGCIVTKEDGTKYLSYILLETEGEPTYTNEEGLPVDKADFAQFQPAYKPSVSQGVDNEVKARTVKLSNVYAWEIV